MIVSTTGSAEAAILADGVELLAMASLAQDTNHKLRAPTANVHLRLSVFICGLHLRVPQHDRQRLLRVPCLGIWTRLEIKEGPA